MSDLRNPAILTKYVLVGSHSVEYLLLLSSELSYKVATAYYSREGHRRVVAVYKSTGRGPFRGEDGRPAWEFEYQGVRITE